jgi:chromosome segregation ATPase
MDKEDIIDALKAELIMYKSRYEDEREKRVEGIQNNVTALNEKIDSIRRELDKRQLSDDKAFTTLRSKLNQNEYDVKSDRQHEQHVQQLMSDKLNDMDKHIKALWVKVDDLVKVGETVKDMKRRSNIVEGGFLLGLIGILFSLIK